MDSGQWKRLDVFVASWGVIISLAALFFSELPIFIGALLGAVVAFINWISFRYLALKISISKKRTRLYILLGLKSVLVLAVVAAIILAGGVNGYGFVFGISSLVLGIVTFSCIQAFEKDEITVKEERS